MCLKDSGLSISTTAIMNPVAIAQFFETTCTGIFNHFLVAESIGKDKLDLF